MLIKLTKVDQIQSKTVFLIANLSIDDNLQSETWSVACPLRKRAVPRSTLASGTFFRGKKFSRPLIQEKQVVSYWQKNGH